eukprot:6414116-Alexandrium_andersonii.AAC.1
MASTSVLEALERWIMRSRSCRFRICFWLGPASVPEALLRGGGAFIHKRISIEPNRSTEPNTT